MDNNKDNCLIKLLLENKTKPNLLKYTLEQLTQIYLEFIENNIGNKLFLEKEYSSKTIDIINSISYDIGQVENDKIKNFVFSDELENVKKKFLINYIYELWKKIPIIDGCGEVIDCTICLNHITNQDHIYFQCEHITHSTCFFNYLFTNINNNSSNDSNIHKNLIKLFRCPNCRNCLTDTINEYTKEYDNGYDNENDNRNYYLNIEQQYDDESNNFILQEYNLFSNNIGDQMLNGFLRISNNSNMFNNYMNFMTNPYVIIDNQDNISSDIESTTDTDTDNENN